MTAPRPSNIVRHDGKARGWAVVIKRRGRIYTKFFADGQYGKDAAFQAACIHGRTLLARLPARAKYIEHCARNTSGVVGVGRTRERSKTGIWHLYYKARWLTPEGRVIQKKFSVEKYGEAEAFKLATEARQEGLRHLKAANRRHTQD
jgi:hypothetical protein